MHYIYIIKHSDSGKAYIGRTKNLKNRFRSHMNRSDNNHLRNAIKLYGLGAFSFEVLETHETLAEVIEAEIFWINLLKGQGAQLYNVAPGGFGGNGLSGPDSPLYGKPRTEDVKKKISLANSGFRNGMFGKIGSKSPLFGIKRTHESISKISGQNHGMSKLDPKIVKSMREEHAETNCSYAYLATKYCVTSSAVGLIIRRMRWKHI